jgi:predicted peptidase
MMPVSGGSDNMTPLTQPFWVLQEKEDKVWKCSNTYF